jgi:hypothetical protein
LFPLYIREYAHAGCRKQEKRSIRDVFGWDVLEHMAEELIEVIGTDIVRVFAEC